jgi:7-carboxy-7-deazaguanine synthase
VTTPGRTGSDVAPRVRGSLRVVEMFGPTLQGEGPSAGCPAVFVRLADCNLTCGPCDTRYSWDWKNYDRGTEARDAFPRDVSSWALARAPRLVVVTGGEPLLQQEALVPVAEELAAHGKLVEIETNGTIAPRPGLAAHVSRFVVSPKLPSMLDAPLPRRIKPRVLAAFTRTGKAVFKFVVATGADVDAVAALEESARLRELLAASSAAKRAGWPLRGELVSHLDRLRTELEGAMPDRRVQPRRTRSWRAPHAGRQPMSQAWRRPQA